MDFRVAGTPGSCKHKHSCVDINGKYHLIYTHPKTLILSTPEDLDVHSVCCRFAGSRVDLNIVYNIMSRSKWNPLSDPIVYKGLVLFLCEY